MESRCFNTPSLYYTLVVCLFWLVLVSAREHLNGPCPYRCHCRRTIVNCTNAAINRPLALPSNTRTLILDRNRLSHITSNHFKGLDKLEILSLKSNNISVIEPSTLSSLSNLRELYLGDNHLKTLHADTFQGNTELRVLSLAGNRLSQAAINDSLQYLHNLLELYLHRNLLSSDEPFPSGFTNMGKLERLELASNNGLRNLSTEIFSYMTDINLQYIGLANCPIEKVENDTLFQFRDMKEIDLSFTDIPIAELQHLLQGLRNSSLVTLNLANVLISDNGDHLTSELFEPLANTPLKKLRLDGNYAAFPRGLHNGFFRHLSHLQELNLDNCQLHSIHSDAFKGLHKLKKLSLKHNFISCLTDCGFVTYGPELKRLEFLDLSHNVISDIQRLVRFHGNVFPNLHFLLLQNNRISALRKGMFESLSKLKGMDLTENPVYYIEPGSFQDLHSLQTLYVQGSIHLQELHNGTFRGLRNLLHLKLNNNQIKNVHAKAFHGLRHLEILELNGNRIGGSSHYRNGWNVVLETSRLQTIDLGNNRINALPSQIVASQPNLKKLILHYNRISHLDSDTFTYSKQLHSLDLAYNDLMQLDQDHLKHLNQLKALSLAGNPFLCTCSIKGFIDWLKLAKLQLDAEDDHRCLGPNELRGKRLLDYSPTSWECTVKVIVVPFICTILLLAFLIGAACLYYKHSKPKHSVLEDKRNALANNFKTECACVKELFPMNGDVTPSSEEVNLEAPLIQESQTYSSDISELIT